jgi:hypothetical protein
LELDGSINIPENLSFYFDFPEIADKREYLHMLPYMKWKMNGRTVGHKQGLYTIDHKQGNDIAGLFHNLDITERLDRSILHFYDKHFLTITDGRDTGSQKETFPKELAAYFPEHIPEDFTLPLLWLEIEYPSAFKAETIEAMTVCINAFPVANKHLYSKAVDVNDFLQIIPLETGDHESLLSVHSLTDARDRIYNELPFDDTPEEQYRTYSLRRGGYERYGKRDVGEYLTRLTDLLESRSSVKSGNVSRDENMEEALSGVHDLIRHIRKSITRFKEKLEIQNYILIDLPDENDVFFVKYWTTNCEQANKIKQYTVLDCTSPDILLDVSGIYTLTRTTGGRYAPQSVERQNLRLKSLADRPVLVTNEDITAFCKKEYGNRVKDVKISKGIMENSAKKQEFIRTMDITLVPPKEAKHFFVEKEAQVLELLLRKNSPATYNYRVFINDEN